MRAYARSALGLRAELAPRTCPVGRVRWTRVTAPVLTGVAYGLVVAPIAVVAITAFSPTDFFAFPPAGISLRWFNEFFSLENMRSAFVLSVEVALTSASLAASPDQRSAPQCMLWQYRSGALDVKIP